MCLVNQCLKDLHDWFARACKNKVRKMKRLYIKAKATNLELE